MATVLIHLTSSKRCTLGTGLTSVPHPQNDHYKITMRLLSILRSYAKILFKIKYSC